MSNGQTAEKTATFSNVTTASAIIFAIIYLGAAWWMTKTFAAGTSPAGANWERAWTIFAGVQSFGFTAIGVLLGTAVQQPRVIDAKGEANKAKDAIKRVISSNEAGGANALPSHIVKSLQEGL